MSRTARPEAYSAVQAAVGTRMRWVREALGLGGAEAARLLGVHQTTLNKIELGERAASIFNVIEFSARFRVSTDFLLRGQLSGKTDEELALVLAAQHPEIVLRRESGTAPDSPGTSKPAGKHRQPRTRAANG